jgi:hypothetical protein
VRWEQEAKGNACKKQFSREVTLLKYFEKGLSIANQKLGSGRVAHHRRKGSEVQAIVE